MGKGYVKDGKQVGLWVAYHENGQLKIKQNSLEQSLLEYEPDYIEGVSRLACQIQLNDDLNNVTVKLRKHELL